MNRLQLKDEISEIDYLQKEFSQFQVLAIDIIPKLKSIFEKQGIGTSELVNNSFEFKFWGLSFISKTEILFDNESKSFKSAELNTYLINDDDQILIITNFFDAIGNIGQYSTINNFAEFYYVNFVKMLKKITLEKEIKFQLG